MIRNAQRNRILRRYKTPGDPIAFSSRKIIAKELGINEDKANEEVLSYNYSYPLYRSVKRPKHFNPYFVYNPRDQVQMDLIFMTEYTNSNNGYKYILVCIDIFSKKLWARPLKTKLGRECATAIQEILNEMDPFLPKSVLFDRGTEFLNVHVNRLLQNNNIKVILPNSEIKAAYAERVNLTLQQLIYRYLGEMQTNSYVNLLQDFVKTYNNRVHRSHGFSPVNAEKTENLDKVRQILMEKKMKTIIAGSKMKQKFKIGDTVRISKYRRIFDRGYKPTFQDEYFKIHNINTRLPIPTYILKSLNTNEIIQGGFYSEELQLVKGDVFMVERVLDERGRGRNKQLLVKWLHFNDTHNSWIPAQNIRLLNRR